MNKSDFVGNVADAAEISKAEAARVIDAVIDTITKALKKGETVSLVGFGTFDVRKRAARTGSQSADRSDDQDQGVQESCVQGWQSTQGRCKLADSLGA
jgi:nucleoid DNA-binding protein